MAALADSGAESLKFISQHLQLKHQDILLPDWLGISSCLHLLDPKPMVAVAGPTRTVQATTEDVLLVGP